MFRLTLLQNARNLTVRNKRELLGLPKNVICADDAMIDVYAQALKAAIANKEPNVLIYGQSGAGKQALAEYIHVNSERCTTRIADGKPSESDGFYRLDCGAESDTILEETLFGHRKGTFTGADDNRGGRFEAAHKGTIFLDELQNSSEKLQQRFLGVIQNGKLFRQGEHELRDVDLRFIAAANEPLDKLVSSKKLREDLYHRLRQIQIDIPPLAQRKADIIPLARHFLQNSEITDEALDALAQFDFPGNVRQLESIIGEMVTSKGSDQALIKIQDLPSEVIDYLRRGHVVSPPPQELETQPDSRDVRPDGPGASPAIAVANDPQAAAVARIIQIAMDGGTYSDLKESELRELDQALEGEVLTIFGHLVLWSCYRRADVTNAAKYLGLDREAANSKAVSLVKNVFKLPHVAEPMEVAGHQLVPEDSKLWDKLREARRTVSGAKERGQKK
ncbi:MAG: sigma 54-interacting transcriptional regulator [Planctomycetota bacterium]